MTIEGSTNKSVLSLIEANGQLRATVLDVSGDWGTSPGACRMINSSSQGSMELMRASSVVRGGPIRLPE
jgi:hypothetical protein